MAESRMELFIETLTGTAFELSCSPLETIVSIKAKIQYSEGIPVSQQHLIWKSQELNDDLCLQDYCIKDGATLKLVLGMRGGPINTRQVSDTKKLKDLAEYVERSSETAGSSGRPLTVLVFHDGDKVHMYTLMERGECAVSPLSGTISETSSVASIKNVEELDQDVAKENEVTREKIVQLQEQLRALNINRPKKLPANAAQTRHPSIQTNPIVEKPKEFYLPPLQRIDAFDSQSKQYLHKTAQSKVKASLTSQCSTSSRIQTLSNDNEDSCKVPTEKGISSNLPAVPKDRSKGTAAFDYISSSISSYALSSPDKSMSSEQTGQSCSNFLPYIASAQGASTVQRKPLSRLSSQSSSIVAVNMSDPCSITKYDPSRMKKSHKQLPVTSSQAMSTRKFIDLEDWLQTRPKTSPDKADCNSIGEKTLSKNKLGREDRGKRKLKHSIKNPLSVSLLSGGKSSVTMHMFADDDDVSYSLTPSVINKDRMDGDSGFGTIPVGSVITNDVKGKELKPVSVLESNEPHLLSDLKSTKASSRHSEDTSRPHSGRKLPLIKAKKKSHKRCSLCSKKTGLATSYTCRCGKNFCASHRYAEVHHCSYDYKTEGRRLLQLNNPVVTASKLPKI